MASYGEYISEEDIQTFKDELANDVLLPEEDLLEASFPEFQENSDKSSNDIYFGTALTDSLIPSNIPEAIDKLWRYNNKVPDMDPPVSAVLKLKGNLSDNYTLDDNYNGLCINLDTIGYKLEIGRGSTLVAI